MKSLPLALTLLLAGLLAGSYLGVTPPEPAGDIAEYFGITESFTNHGTVVLTPADQESLSARLHPEYFSNPGYYVAGLDGQRYPVHFVAYSLMITPLRWLLERMGSDPLHVFSLANTLILFGTLFFIMKRYVHDPKRQTLLLALAGTSPLLSFLWWPGPDVFSFSLLLTGLTMFLTGRKLPAAFVTAVASWHSQPLAVAAAMMLGAEALERYHTKGLTARFWTFSTTLAVLVLGPYVYNYAVFGRLTPWSALSDGWTRLYGFGLHNISGIKLFEQVFDLNTGVFWYAPHLIIGSIAIILFYIKRDQNIAWLSGILLATLLAYQTNPAWHYGTSGYGPSRHALVIVPFGIALLTRYFPFGRLASLLAGIAVVFQIYLLSYNNYIFPIFTNTLDHAPVARYVLERWPSLYSPTPEIFVDRTNHTDLDHPTSAVYKVNGACRKAYILAVDYDRIAAECGTPSHIDTPTILNPETDGMYATYE